MRECAILLSFLFLGWIYLRNVAARTRTTARDARTAHIFQHAHKHTRKRRKMYVKSDDEGDVVGDRANVRRKEEERGKRKSIFLNYANAQLSRKFIYLCVAADVIKIHIS